MNETLKRECMEVLAERASFYRLLSSLYYREVDDDLLARLDALRVDEADLDEEMAAGYRELLRYLARRGPDARTDLAVDYARAFCAAGTYEGDAACPYESIYTSEEGLVMQEARDEVRALFLAHGVNVSEEVHEPEDHVSFELEFMAVMSERAAQALEAGDVQALAEALHTSGAFAQDHLLNWFDAWGERVDACTEQRFYPAVFKITRSYVRNDRELVAQMEDVLGTCDERHA